MLEFHHRSSILTLKKGNPMLKKDNFKQNLKAFFQKYKHAWVLLYVFIYFPWFTYLEKHVTSNFNVIHTALDD